MSSSDRDAGGRPGAPVEDRGSRKPSSYFVKLGDERCRGGALYVPKPSESLEQSLDTSLDIRLEMERSRLRASGVPITQEMEDWLRGLRDTTKTKYLERVRRAGVPAHLRSLFAATKKKDAEKIAGQIIIAAHELKALVFNCPDDGWTHRMKEEEFVPDDLHFSQSEILGLLDSGKLWGQAKRLFAHRKYRQSHLFERGDEWHCMWFSYEDAFLTPENPTNHWSAGGTHLHYASYLWGLSKEALWKSLDERRSRFAGTHVRFINGRVGVGS